MHVPVLVHVFLLCWSAYLINAYPSSSLHPINNPGPPIIYDVPGTTTSIHITPGRLLPPRSITFVLVLLHSERTRIYHQIQQKGHDYPVSEDFKDVVKVRQESRAEFARLQFFYTETDKGRQDFRWQRLDDAIRGLADVIKYGQLHVLDYIIRIVDRRTDYVLGFEALDCHRKTTPNGGGSTTTTLGNSTVDAWTDATEIGNTTATNTVQKL